MKHAVIRNIPMLLICLLTLVFAKLQYNKMGGNKTDICMAICSDGRGYYAWLPAIFIYDDVNFNFFEQVEVKSPLCGGPIAGCLQDYRSCTDGTVCNKYYPGTAFMMLPFFAAGHWYTKTFTTLPADGYTYYYFAAIAISGIFYYLIGMWLLLRILKKIGLSTTHQTLTVLLVTLGTNILYFSVDKPSYSHIYSFAEIGAFLYCALLLRERFTTGRLVFLSFLVGLIFITRPVNVSVLLLLPFLYRDQMPAILANWRRAVWALPVIVMPLVLLCLYKKATGHYFIYSYGSEGFDFLRPNLIQFLFHYDNGVFPYTPLLLMPFLLLFLWYRKEQRWLVMGAVVTLAVTIYIHSSWWCWWYGYSFGARTLLDFATLFGLIIGLSIRDAGKHRRILLPLYFACGLLTILLYHEKNHGYMNAEAITDYWDALKGLF